MDIILECQKCGKKVNHLQGNGEYPNPTWYCDGCHADEWALIFFVSCILVLLFVGVVVPYLTIK